jgi:hypothetical protein
MPKPRTFREQVDAMLAERAPVGMFEIAASRFHRAGMKRQLADCRKDVRSYIRPENARDVIPHLPAPGERTHCVLRGDFVLCSLIPAIIAARGNVAHLMVASSLGVSKANTDTLASLLDQRLTGRLTILTSTYFSAVDHKDIYAYCHRELAARRAARIIVARVHAKVLLMATASGDHFAIEGSANLRANDGIEQMTIYNDAALHAFHAAWIEEIASQEETPAASPQ